MACQSAPRVFSGEHLSRARSAPGVSSLRALVACVVGQVRSKLPVLALCAAASGAFAAESPGVSPAIVPVKPGDHGAVLYTSADGLLTVSLSDGSETLRASGHGRADEFFYVLGGEVELRGTGAVGGAVVFGPGDAFVLPRGFVGEWYERSPARTVAVRYVGMGARAVEADASPLAVVRADQRLLDASPWVPVENAPFARVVSGGTPRYRAEAIFRSSDGRLTVDVSSYETMTLEITRWPIDEFMLFVNGRVELRDRDGRGGVYGPGDAMVTPTGWTGTWQQASPITKFAVSYDPLVDGQ